MIIKILTSIFFLVLFHEKYNVYILGFMPTDYVCSFRMCNVITSIYHKGRDYPLWDSFLGRPHIVSIHAVQKCSTFMYTFLFSFPLTIAKQIYHDNVSIILLPSTFILKISIHSSLLSLNTDPIIFLSSQLFTYKISTFFHIHFYYIVQNAYSQHKVNW